jgi:hypothetical protein
MHTLNRFKLALLIGVHLALASADSSNFYDLISHQPIAGLPQGTYAQWLEEERRNALKLIGQAVSEHRWRQ